MSASAKKVAKTGAPKPTFKEMITQAIKAQGPCSRQAIRKYLVSTYAVPEKTMKSNLNKALGKLISSSYLVHPKTKQGTFKLNPVETTKAKAKKSTTATQKKAAVKKTKAVAKKKVVAAKKPKKTASATKKTTVKKTTTKKTAKKPAAKKTPKKTAKKTVKKAASKKK